MLDTLKGLLLYILIILAIVVVGLVILFVPEPPLIEESILDTITLKNGRFALDGLTGEMSEADVAASLDARDLIYTSSRDAEVIWTQNMNSSWLSLADATRIEELGKMTIRRTYYFENDNLSMIELEGKAGKRQAEDAAKGFERLWKTLDEALLPHSRELGSFLSTSGNRTYEWAGEDGSYLLLSGTLTTKGELKLLIRITV